MTCVNIVTRLERFTVVSDRQKGLIFAIADVFPEAGHDFWPRHIMDYISRAGICHHCPTTMNYLSTSSSLPSDSLRTPNLLSPRWPPSRPIRNEILVKDGVVSCLKCEKIIHTSGKTHVERVRYHFSKKCAKRLRLLSSPLSFAQP